MCRKAPLFLCSTKYKAPLPPIEFPPFSIPIPFALGNEPANDNKVTLDLCSYQKSPLEVSTYKLRLPEALPVLQRESNLLDFVDMDRFHEMDATKRKKADPTDDIFLVPLEELVRTGGKPRAMLRRPAKKADEAVTAVTPSPTANVVTTINTIQPPTPTTTILKPKNRSEVARAIDQSFLTRQQLLHSLQHPNRPGLGIKSLAPLLPAGNAADVSLMALLDQGIDDGTILKAAVGTDSQLSLLAYKPTTEGDEYAYVRDFSIVRSEATNNLLAVFFGPTEEAKDSATSAKFVTIQQRMVLKKRRGAASESLKRALPRLRITRTK